MEDDLYGGLSETPGAVEAASDANLYEGLFAGPSAAGHHETYLQHKVNELEETLRSRNTELQLLNAKLHERERKLGEVTAERDVLLRNISCLYNTAKEEMARKQAEINNLRAEVAQAMQRQNQQQQQQLLVKGCPQLARQPTSGFELRQPARQALPGGAGSKRSRDGSADVEGPQQAGGKQVSGVDSWAGIKRSRSDGVTAVPWAGTADEEPGAHAAVLNGCSHQAGTAPPTRTGPHGDAAAGPAGAAWRNGSASNSGARIRSVSSGGSLEDSRLNGQHNSSDRSRGSSHPGASGSGRLTPHRGDSPSAPGYREPWHERDLPGDKLTNHSRASDRPGGDDGKRGNDGDRGRVGAGRMEDRRGGRRGQDDDRDRRY